MEQGSALGEAWTAARVKARLIETFRALPGAPVYSFRAKVTPLLGGIDASPLTWCPRFVPNRDYALALLIWANCRATGQSVRERYGDLKVPRTSADRWRAVALAQIVAGLRAEQRGLDNGAKGFGLSEPDEARLTSRD